MEYQELYFKQLEKNGVLEYTIDNMNKDYNELIKSYKRNVDIMYRLLDKNI